VLFNRTPVCGRLLRQHLHDFEHPPLARDFRSLRCLEPGYLYALSRLKLKRPLRLAAPRFKRNLRKASFNEIARRRQIPIEWVKTSPDPDEAFAKTQSIFGPPQPVIRRQKNST